MKNIKIRITNSFGHEELVQELSAAIQTIIDAHNKQKQWAYIGTNAFHFTATSPNDPAIYEDARRLKDLLTNSSEDVVVTLTGDLVGGWEQDTNYDDDDDDVLTEEEEEEEEGCDEKVQLSKEEIVSDLMQAVSRSVSTLYTTQADPQPAAPTEVFELEASAINNPLALLQQTVRLYEQVAASGGAPVRLVVRNKPQA